MLDSLRYLRKWFFPKHQDLQYAGKKKTCPVPVALNISSNYKKIEPLVCCFFFVFFKLSLKGLLNPLDSPHHMRTDDESEYREGVVLDRPTKQGQGSLVNCGMRKVGFCCWRLKFAWYTDHHQWRYIRFHNGKLYFFSSWEMILYSEAPKVSEIGIVSDYPSVRLDCANLLPQDVRIDKQLQSGLRVTVQLSRSLSPGIFALITHKQCAL